MIKAVQVLLSVLAVFCAVGPVAGAEGFPSRTIRFVVPFPAGGATDAVTRVVAARLNDYYKQQMTMVDNRAGAGGVIGSEVAARATPDGYTLIMGTTGTHAINATLFRKPSYDPIKDFVAVTPAALLPNMLVVHPSVPAKSVKEYVALAKANPGQLSYASAGNFLYLSGALFVSMAQIEMLHVPFKGGAQAMPAVVSGEVASSFATIVSSLPLVNAGKLRALAVTSAKRFPGAPQFPTVAESGMPGYEAVAWYGVFAPAGTPAPIVNQLNADIVRVVNSREVGTLLVSLGAQPYALSPAEFAAVVRKDVAKWGDVVRKVGAQVN